MNREYNTDGLPEADKKLIDHFRRSEGVATEMIQKYNLPILYGTDSFGSPDRVAKMQLDDFRFIKNGSGAFEALPPRPGT